MDDESSNDVEAVEVHEEEENIDDKPLMALFNSLIKSDNKQGTILSNIQVMNLLTMEFGINVRELDEFEVGVYMSIMKKFLKHWPQWDEFDRVLKLRRSQEGINQLLKVKYKSLKKYLQSMLNIAQEMIKELGQRPIQPKKTEENTDVVMEIHCSRWQLNELILQHPKSDSNNSVFNLVDSIPMKISVFTPPPSTLLNWPGFALKIKRQHITLKRTISQEMEHVLVNEKLKKPPKYDPICMKPQISIQGPQTINSSFLNMLLASLKKSYVEEKGMYEFLNSVCKTVRKEFSWKSEIEVAHYKRHLFRYDYIRKLRKEGEETQSNKKYDLYILERFRPMYIYEFQKIKPRRGKWELGDQLLELTCTICNVSYFGSDIIVGAVEHYLMHHQNEPDWTCSNCEEVFPMILLAQGNWKHMCERNVKTFN